MFGWVVCVARKLRLGEVCGEVDECAAANSGCLSGICDCVAGYSNIGGICSKSHDKKT